jgi:hypothetical protein
LNHDIESIPDFDVREARQTKLKLKRRVRELKTLMTDVKFENLLDTKRDDVKDKLEKEIDEEAKVSVALSALRVKAQAKNKTPEEVARLKEELAGIVNQRELNFANFADLVSLVKNGDVQSFGFSPTGIDDAIYFADPTLGQLTLNNGRNANERLVAKYFINGHLRTNNVIDEINRSLDGRSFEITAESALADIKTYTANIHKIGKDVDEAYDKLEIGKKYKDEDKHGFLESITTESWLVEDLERKVKAEIEKLTTAGVESLSEPEKYSLKKYEFVIKQIAKIRDTTSITPIEGAPKSFVDKIKEKLERIRMLKESELKEKIKGIEDKLSESEKELNTASAEILQLRGANIARVKGEKEAIRSGEGTKLEKYARSAMVQSKDPAQTFHEAKDMVGRMKDTRAIITDARREAEDMLEHFDATDSVKFKKYEKIKKRLLAKVRRQKRRAASMGWRYLGLLSWKEKGMYIGDKLVSPIGDGASWLADLVTDKFTPDL